MSHPPIRKFLLLLLVAAAPPPTAAADVLTEIDVCIAQVEFDIGLGGMAARCPALERQLRTSEWAAWLPAGWNADDGLSADSLAALRMVLARERALPAPARSLKVANLRPILATLAARNQHPQGWWARFRSWLRAALSKSDTDSGADLGRFFSRVSLPEFVLEAITYAILALVVALAGFIIVNEWRARGTRGQRPRAHAAGGALSGARVAALSWQDIEHAALAERPRLLLELIAARLTAAHRLPATASLTVRELTRAARLHNADDRERLVEVALVAERLRFSAEPVAAANLTGVLARGRELLERLDTLLPIVA
jgi:hypothetical protein